MQSCNTHSPENIRMSLERWSNWTQHDIDSDNTIVNTVNALIAVSAFIAGVQSQIIAFTWSLPRSRMANITNVIGFVGLVLDVIGTFLGVIHAIVLQRRIRENTTVLNAMTQVSTSLMAMQNLQNTVANPEKITPDQMRGIGIDDPDQHMRRAQQLIEVLQDRFKSRTISRRFGLTRNVLQAAALANSTMIGSTDTRAETMLKSLFGLGHTPLFAMGLGVLALINSVIMFAAESELPSEVWVSCVAVLGGVIAFSLIPITYDLTKNIMFPRSTESLPE